MVEYFHIYILHAEMTTLFEKNNQLMNFSEFDSSDDEFVDSNTGPGFDAKGHRIFLENEKEMIDYDDMDRYTKVMKKFTEDFVKYWEMCDEEVESGLKNHYEFIEETDVVDDFDNE